MAKKTPATATSKQSKKQSKNSQASTMGWRKQVVETYKVSSKSDPALKWWMLGAFVIGAAVGFGVIYAIPPQGGTVDYVVSGVAAFLVGFLAMMIVFSRRAQRAAYSSMAGQLGAGARALTLLRRGWKIDEVVAFTKQQDMVHRVVGPPGIVLVGEGNPNRLRNLLVSERRKHERAVGETPIQEVVVGDGEGQVPLDQLVRHVRKLKRGLAPAEMTDVLYRLRALDAQRPKAPVPHGPVPTSMKGMRGQQRGR